MSLVGDANNIQPVRFVYLVSKTFPEQFLSYSLERAFEMVLKILIFAASLLIDDGYAKNVLLMVADDAGFETRTYNNKICQTPNIDALAKKSLIFNYAFTAVSSCSPSRSAILTGRPNHENGMYGLHQGVHHFNSFGNLKSLPKILQENNVRTGIVGKKHVGPAEVYKFDYEKTEEQESIMQVGRNITHMKLLVRDFLASSKDKPFFLYIGFHDPHRCGHTNPEFGAFCEKFGNGYPENGVIPDWIPIYYQHDEIILPYFMPNTDAAKQDVSAQYTTISRLDQGIGLMIKELETAGVLNDTLIIYTSDNGVPFPSGRTNLYDPGMAVPMLVSSPNPQHRSNEVTYGMTSLLDITPTILDWFGVKPVEDLTGRSFIPLLTQEPVNENRSVFGSHSHHEVTMYYPMRAIRTKRYKLIHNLNYQTPFPIDQDFYLSPTFQDMLDRVNSSQQIPWYKTLQDYYYRPEWELYDLKMDPIERQNLAGKPVHSDVFQSLKNELQSWLNKTQDPWLCGPNAVLQNKGMYKTNPQCLPLYNEIKFN